ncbi:MAG: CBS domain-containing protein [Bilophila wadsworthia]
MTGKGFGCVGIMEKGILVGIITDGDLRRHMDGGLLGLTAERVMSRNPITVDEHCLAAKALGIMQSSKITSLYVARGGEPVGILSVHDCLRAGVN